MGGQVVGWSRLFEGVKNLWPRVLVPVFVGMFLLVLGVIFVNSDHAKKERKSWSSLSYGQVWNKSYPYVGQLPYGYVWSEEWKEEKESYLWEAARDKAITGLNEEFLRRWKRLLWVSYATKESTTRIEIKPAPQSWYDVGMPCEEAKPSQARDLQKGAFARFLATWDVESGRLIRAWIGVCVKKFDAVMGWVGKLDRSGFREEVKRLGREGILKHEMLHPLIGLGHPRVRCVLMCSSPRGLGLGSDTIRIIEDTLKRHDESEGLLNGKP